MSAPLSLRLTLWLALAALFGGCDDGSSDALDELPCDIRRSNCRRAVFSATVRVREQTGAALPPSRMITRAKFAASVAA